MLQPDTIHSSFEQHEGRPSKVRGMFRQGNVLRLPGLVAALLLALLLTHTLVASEEAPLGARTLLPGDNLIGWVGYATTTEAFFEQIPEAELVYTWDAQLSRYRFAAPGLEASLSMIEPGMGLIVRIGGNDPVNFQSQASGDD